MKSLIATLVGGILLVPVVSTWADPSRADRTDRVAHIDLLAVRDILGEQALDGDRPVVPAALLEATDPAAPRASRGSHASHASGKAVAVVDDSRPIPEPPVPRESRVVIVESESGVETEIVESWNKPLFVSGAIAFGLSYGGALIGAGASDRPEDRSLLVPVAGPWLDLAERGNCAVEREPCRFQTTTKVLLVADGIIQGGSVIAMVAGLLTHTRQRVVTTTVAKSTKKKTRVIPTGGEVTGLAIRGVW
jgi:hypothetical protein